MDIHSSITLAVVVLFFWQSLKYGAWQWFWASIVIWLAAAWFSAELLPRVMGVTHAANLYLAHAYILLASVFFWVNHVQKQPDAQEYRSTAGPMLTYFARRFQRVRRCRVGRVLYAACTLVGHDPVADGHGRIGTLGVECGRNRCPRTADYRVERAGICLAGCFYRVGFETALPSIFMKRPIKNRP